KALKRSRGRYVDLRKHNPRRSGAQKFRDSRSSSSWRTIWDRPRLRAVFNRLDAEPGVTQRHSKNPPVSPLQYCSARDLKAIFNFFLFIDLQKGTGDASIVRLRYHRKHLWIVTCYYKIS